MWTKLKEFVKGVVAELKKVSWASRRELVGATGAVLVLTIIMTLFVFGMDQLFNWLLALLIKAFG
ncbi:preprotein translocase subunit SecE [candidate division WOR-3 bacterium]|uniref:Protein translocase subunit SecE n=1 Tax=candidate division WOR-3 bacterium TaxID=2052148 RepID=A0A9D5QCV1_UNCW3|nr:preprotein translocase subunit SecE [candidate division WOR-3 bacterium]MBD3364437.1 preprotein translocase subunit SecE [candidate division WOR-3 bacterium]